MFQQYNNHSFLPHQQRSHFKLLPPLPLVSQSDSKGGKSPSQWPHHLPWLPQSHTGASPGPAVHSHPSPGAAEAPRKAVLTRANACLLSALSLGLFSSTSTTCIPTEWVPEETQPSWLVPAPGGRAPSCPAPGSTHSAAAQPRCCPTTPRPQKCPLLFVFLPGELACFSYSSQRRRCYKHHVSGEEAAAARALRCPGTSRLRGEGRKGSFR